MGRICHGIIISQFQNTVPCQSAVIHHKTVVCQLAWFNSFLPSQQHHQSIYVGGAGGKLILPPHTVRDLVANRSGCFEQYTCRYSFTCWTTFTICLRRHLFFVPDHLSINQAINNTRSHLLYPSSTVKTLCEGDLSRARGTSASSRRPLQQHVLL